MNPFLIRVPQPPKRPAAPPVYVATALDPALCRQGNGIWLNHDFANARTPTCRRCGMKLADL